MSDNSIAGFARSAEPARRWVNGLTVDLGWREQSPYRLIKTVRGSMKKSLRHLWPSA